MNDIVAIGSGLHIIMTIYYYCTGDSALLLSFLTNLPSLYLLSFHGSLLTLTIFGIIIFIKVNCFIILQHFVT